MNTPVRIAITDYQKKLGGYVAMLFYRYGNLCVKADPLSLLGVTVLSDQGAEKIEEAANIEKGPDKFSMFVHPKYKNRLTPISKGILREHPEFQIDLFDNETGNKANLPDDLDKSLYIKLTMPKVDKNRHDALKDTVNTLYHQTEALLDTNKAEYDARIASLSHGEEEKELDAIKEEMKNTYDSHKSKIDNLREDKLREIEEAYEKYLEDNSGNTSESVEISNFGEKTDDDKPARENAQAQSLKL